MMNLKAILFLSLNTCAVVYLLIQTFQFVSLLSGNKSGLLRTKSSDGGHILLSLLQDTFLLLTFMCSHSFFATNFAKSLTSYLGLHDLHRTIYIWLTGLSLKFLADNWICILSGVPLFWNLSDHGLFVIFTQTAHVIGWLLTFSGIFILDFPEFIGTKQIWLMASNVGCPIVDKSKPAKKFLENMRHPLYLGFVLVLWLVPCMTLDRFVLASGLTVYIAWASKLSETDYEYLKKMRHRKELTLKILSENEGY